MQKLSSVTKTIVQNSLKFSDKNESKFTQDVSDVTQICPKQLKIWLMGQKNSKFMQNLSNMTKKCLK